MHREGITLLTKWKNAAEHLPILLRGARQVGKTTLVEQFATKNFPYFVNINFELEPDYSKCFQTLKPQEIIDNILIKQNIPIIPGNTLLFLDEIQICPQAITALRYFKEQMPELHIIGAGSLLEFAIADEKIHFPVGRVQFMYLQPLSFYEYLIAQGKTTLIDQLTQVTLLKPLTDIAHQELIKLLKEYLVLGGMPAVLDSYLKYHNLNACQNLQTNLLATYRNDFGKYAKFTKHKYLQQVFVQTPNLVGKQVKYAHIDAASKAVNIKEAINLLTQAGLIYKVCATSGSGIPLQALSNDKKFKLIFVDVGLMHRAGKIDISSLLSQEFSLINQGTIMEQFVGQELVAYQDAQDESEIYFWERDKQGSQAEVDYVISLNGNIIPVEVKSGKVGRLKSLQQFIFEKQVPLGVQVSWHTLSMRNRILTIPPYMLHELKRIYTTQLDVKNI